MSRYNSLCLSGGAMRGFELLGAISYLSEIINLKSITKFYGTSIGSMICYLLAIGYSSTELLIEISKSKFWDKLRNLNVMQMIQDGSCSSFTPIQEFLEKITIKKIGKLINMEQLKKEYGKELSVVTYNFTSKCKEVLNYENNPELPCITAIRMSSVLPFFFSPYKYGDSFYLDGGLINPFPIDLIKEPKKSISICLSAGENESNILKMTNFNPIIYAKQVLDISISNMICDSIKKSKKIGTELINIQNTNNMNSTNFNMTITEKLDLFSSGYNAAKSQYLVS
jgi:predicted acylesterase/phospholipase RssA